MPSSNRSKKPIERLMVLLMNTRNEAQLLHWRTRSYAEHKTTDDFFQHLQKKIDEFAEVLQGLISRRLDFSLDSNTSCRTFQYKNITKIQFLASLNRLEKQLVKITSNYHLDLPPPGSSKDMTGLLNIRDEIVAEIQQTRYLLTFV